MANFRRARFAVPLLLLGATLISVPAFAQVDFSGEWGVRFYEDQPDRGPGPEVGDYLGLPINAAARARGYAWEASMWTLPEWQCRPHGADYMWRSLSELKIWKEVNPVTRAITAYHFEWLRSLDNPVYMDGRPHPPEYAAHTWGGFATGKWEGDMLTVTITHLKESYIRRNGVPRSDLATVTEHLVRHGNWLTVTVTSRLFKPLISNWTCTSTSTLIFAKSPTRWKGPKGLCRTSCRGRTRTSRNLVSTTGFLKTSPRVGPRPCIRSTGRSCRAWSRSIRVRHAEGGTNEKAGHHRFAGNGVYLRSAESERRRRRGPRPEGARRHLHAGGGRRKHHRVGNQRRCGPGGRGSGADVRQGACGHPEDHRSAGSLHHQHPRSRGSHRRE